MNWRRGFLRTWIALSVAWVLVVIGAWYVLEHTREPQAPVTAQLPPLPSGFVLDRPTQGGMFADLIPRENRQWGANDPIVSGRPEKSWNQTFFLAAIALGPPLALGGLALVLGWIVRGFRNSN